MTNKIFRERNVLSPKESELVKQITSNLRQIFRKRQDLDLTDRDYHITKVSSFLAYLAGENIDDVFLFNNSVSIDNLMSELNPVCSDWSTKERIDRSKLLKMLDSGLEIEAKEIKNKYKQFIDELDGRWRTAEGSTRIIEMEFDKGSVSFYENYKKYGLNGNHVKPSHTINVNIRRKKKPLGVAKSLYYVSPLVETIKDNLYNSLDTKDKRRIFVLSCYGLLKELQDNLSFS